MKNTLTKILFFLLSFFSFNSCSKDFDWDVVRADFSTIEKTRFVLKPILIGDSKVGGIKSTKGFNKLNLQVGFFKPGINTEQLINLLDNISVDSTINCVVVSIGTNDGYKGDKSKLLKGKLFEVYPNLVKLFVIRGSIGWGSVKNKSTKDQDSFYSKFQLNGFELIKINNCVIPSDKLAHTPNTPYYQEIITKLSKILK